MEENSNYKAIQVIIHNLSQQLESILELQLQQDFNLMRREIEEHFERVIHALRARQQILIEQLNLISHKQDSMFEEITESLKGKINMCKEIAQAGVSSFKHSVASANLVWQEALKLDCTPVDTCSLLLNVDLELPTTEFLERIDNHGKVESSAQYLDSIDKLLKKSLETSPVDYLPVKSTAKTITLVGASSVLAGSTRGFADGTGKDAKFSFPVGICYNPHDDYLYVCDNYCNAIRRVSLNRGKVKTLLAESTIDIFFNKFKYPRRMVYSKSSHTFYITSHDHRVFAADSKGKATLLAGNKEGFKEGYKDGVGREARFNTVDGIAIHQRTGILYVADSGNHKIREVTPKGEVSTFVGLTQGFADGTSKIAKFDTPTGICFDERSQSLLVCDSRNNRIRRVTTEGNVSTICDLIAPVDITIAHDIILVLTKESLVAIQQDLGKYTTTDIAQFQSNNNNVMGITVHEPSHSIFWTDGSGNTIHKQAYELR